MADRTQLVQGKQRERVATGIYRKPSGKYLATYRDPGSRQHWKEFRTIADAARWRAQALLDPAALGSGKRTLQAVWETFCSQKGSHLRPTTRANWEQQWRAHIAPTFAKWPVGKIGVKDVKEWLADLERLGVGAATRHKCRSILHRLFEEAIENGELAAHANPARAKGTRVRLPQRKRARILAPAEVVAVIRAAKSVASDTDAMALEMLFFLGLRIGEMAALRASDINLRSGEVTVRRTVIDVGGHVSVQDATKTNRARTLPLPQELPVRDHLAAYMRTRGLIGNAQLFAAPAGGLLRPNNWRKRVWTKATEAANIIDPPTPHSGRRTTASLLQMSGVPPATIQAILGHSTLAQTGEYIDVPKTEMEAGFRKLAALFES